MEMKGKLQGAARFSMIEIPHRSRRGTKVNPMRWRPIEKSARWAAIAQIRSAPRWTIGEDNGAGRGRGEAGGRYLSRNRDRVSSGIPVQVLVAREAKERARPSCSKRCCVSALSRPLSHLSLSLRPSPSTVFGPSQSFLPDWFARPVIHRKHRMQTVT